ncbi:hypothetical protein MKX03_031749 [Papaver bracteatum]|nr:hypothetical protein MKX03_031749 [Papaver bracteatum]
MGAREHSSSLDVSPMEVEYYSCEKKKLRQENEEIEYYYCEKKKRKNEKDQERKKERGKRETPKEELEDSEVSSDFYFIHLSVHISYPLSIKLQNVCTLLMKC